MDQNLQKVKDYHVKSVMKALEKRNFESFYCENLDELYAIFEKLIADDTKVTHGGSVTLAETGIMDYLNKRQITFWDRRNAGASKEEQTEFLKQAFHADTYVMSSSAITMDGEIYNIDGNGNRLAAMMYGPSQVLIIVGTNKIVNDLEEAKKRTKNISAPANCIRLDKTTPCTLVGECKDCRSVQRICAHEVITSWQTTKRIKIIFVNGDYGY